MSTLLFSGLFACGGGPLQQAGHRLEIEETKTWSLGQGTRHGVDLILDGKPLAMEHGYHPLSPPPARAPRTVYFGDDWTAETWAYDTWPSFQIVAADPVQHQAAKAFLDAGTDDLFARLARTKAYTWSYPRHQFVLFESEPATQVFVAPSGDRFEVTPTGYVFFDGAIIGKLAQERGAPTGLELRLEPHTVGSGPAAVRVQPAVTDPLQYRHAVTGQDVYAFYGFSPGETVERRPSPGGEANP